MIKLFSTLLFLLLLSSQVFSTTIKIATAYPEGTEALKTLRTLDQTLRQQTDGRIELKIYPAGVMGSDDAVRRKMQIGQLDASLAQSSAWTDEFPILRVYGLPFLFDDAQQVTQLRSQFDADILDESGNDHFEILGIIDGGMAYAITREPVSSMKQLREQKLWLPSDPVLSFYARQFKLKTIDLSIAEVAPSLQTGAINGLIVPPAAAITLQWHNSLKYLTDIPAIYSFGVLVINQRTLAKLSPEDRQTMRTVTQAALQQLDSKMVKQNAQAVSAFSHLGIEIIEPSANEISQLKTSAQEVWIQAVAGQLIPERPFQQVMKLLTQLSSH